MWMDDILFALSRSQRLIATALIALAAYGIAEQTPVIEAGREIPPVVLTVIVLMSLTVASRVVNLVGQRLSVVEYASLVMIVLAAPLFINTLMAFGTARVMMVLWSGSLLVVAAVHLLPRSHTSDSAQKAEAALDLLSGLTAGVLGCAGLALIALGDELAWVFLVTLGHAAAQVICVLILLDISDQTEP